MGLSAPVARQSLAAVPSHFVVAALVNVLSYGGVKVALGVGVVPHLECAG